MNETYQAEQGRLTKAQADEAMRDSITILADRTRMMIAMRSRREISESYRPAESTINTHYLR